MVKTPATPSTQFARILIVDDEPDLRTLYELTLIREGHLVESAGDLAQAREALSRGSFDVLLTDMRLPDGMGLELLGDLARAQRSERTVVITAYGSAENAVEALKAGAFDYLTKPVDLRAFRDVVRQAWHGAPPLPRAAEKAAAAQRSTVVTGDQADAALARIVGGSLAMVEIKSKITKVARSMAPILVRGESGTGKEQVARAIHACSHRHAGPFVAVNCSAIPESLMESEFFGAKKGAYTGAVQDRQGYFQAANGGTLFLDELGDLPLPMQAKLLRAIQERIVRPIGSTAEDPVDVRIVSATHKDLVKAVDSGDFRQDLYYRINVIELVLPPLRHRRDDLPALCAALLSRIALDSGEPAAALSERSMRIIEALPLNGNVRELENLLHRALALRDGEMLEIDVDAACTDGSANGGPASPVSADEPIPTDLQQFLDNQERHAIEQALRATSFNRTAAAQLLGMNLRQIRYRIERLGITAPIDHDGSAA